MAQARVSQGVAPAEDVIADAYVYLLGRVLVIRQEHLDRAGEGFAYNVVSYNPLGSADFVNPNLDVAYLEAWFAVGDDTAVLLEVPEVAGRYSTAQILDEWGEVIVNVNERATPAKPFGTFALVKPGSNPTIPDEATRIELHSSKAKLLARVELQGDPDGALELQHAFKVRALNHVDVVAPPLIPGFDNATLLGVEIFDDVEAILASALDVSPLAAAMQLQVRAVADYVASGDAARAAVDSLLREKVVPEFKTYALTKSAPSLNHWIGGAQTGNYGADYRLRSSANYLGIWANTAKEVVYFVTNRDADEQPLDGSSSYVIHFPADDLPDSIVDSYWSIILVGVPDYRVVTNPLDRYNLNSYSGLASEPDGSLKIALGPDQVPGVADSNWLPSAKDKPFSLTFRAYVPKDFVAGGQWAPPAVTRAE
jgi:hypothetical protein